MFRKYKDILIVEDQPFFQDILEGALQEFIPDESCINKVNSGNAANAFLKQNSDSVGLILLDMRMDDGDGFTVLNFLDEASYNIPIYIVSSLDSEFVAFIMQSISELEVRLVGFVPKEAPNLVTERINNLSSDILGFLVQEVTEQGKSNSEDIAKLEYSIQDEDFSNKLRNDLILYVQPKLNMQYGYITSYEILSRLCDDDRGILDPAIFFGALNTVARRIEFNWIVLEKVFSFQRDSIEKGLLCTLSVNVSPETLGQEGFVERFKELSILYGADLNSLIIELTEDTYNQGDITRLEFNIARLKLLGVKISLDDLGKGYANFDRVERIPFDEIKIDMHIISRVMNSEEERNFVESIVSYIQTKKCSIVAEGVEDKETNDYLKSIGVHEVQGYYHSMPKPVSDIDLIFAESLKKRVSALLGDVGSENFVDMYQYFYTSTIEMIDNALNDDDLNRKDFVHKIKGTLKTAGLYEALVFIEKYQETGEQDNLLKLKKFLDFFNKNVVTKLS